VTPVLIIPAKIMPTIVYRQISQNGPHNGGIGRVQLTRIISSSESPFSMKKSIGSEDEVFASLLIVTYFCIKRYSSRVAFFFAFLAGLGNQGSRTEVAVVFCSILK